MALPLGSWWCLSAVCLGLSSVSPYPYQREDHFLLYPDSYEDSTEAAESYQDQALRWDKLFVGMENTEMKQNMILHYLNEVLAPDLQALRYEIQKSLRSRANASAASKKEELSEQLATARSVLMLEEAGQKQPVPVHLLLGGIWERLEAVEKILMQQPRSNIPESMAKVPTDPNDLPGSGEAILSLNAEDVTLKNMHFL